MFGLDRFPKLSVKEFHPELRYFLCVGESKLTLF